MNSEDPKYGIRPVDHSHDPATCPNCIAQKQRQQAKAPHDRQLKASRRNR